jgi:Flp pilus assembly protein TadD
MRCDFPAALVAYRKGLALQPDNAVAASNLGVTQLWMGRSAEAVASLEVAVRHAPNEYLVRANLGDAYRAVGRNEAKAADAYARSIALAREQLRLNPRDATAHSYIATDLAKTGHAAEADAEMNRALELDSKDASILVDAAVVAALAGRKAEAIDWLRKGVQAGYCRDVIARQPEFESLRRETAFAEITKR